MILNWSLPLGMLPEKSLKQAKLFFPETEQLKNFKNSKGKIVNKKGEDERNGIGTMEVGIHKNNDAIKQQFAKIDQHNGIGKLAGTLAHRLFECQKNQKGSEV